MSHDEYRKRALQSKDPRFAQIFDKLGYERRDMQAAPEPKPVQASAPTQVRPSFKPTPVEPAPDDRAELRDEYRAVIGKRPFLGWDAATLRRKIDEHTAAHSSDGEE